MLGYSERRQSFRPGARCLPGSKTRAKSQSSFQPPPKTSSHQCHNFEVQPPRHRCEATVERGPAARFAGAHRGRRASELELQGGFLAVKDLPAPGKLAVSSLTSWTVHGRLHRTRSQPGWRHAAARNPEIKHGPGNGRAGGIQPQVNRWTDHSAGPTSIRSQIQAFGGWRAERAAGAARGSMQTEPTKSSG